MPDELKHEIAGQVAGLLWSAPAEASTENERVELTDDQRAAIRLIGSVLPSYWLRRIASLLDDEEGDSTPVPLPA